MHTTAHRTAWILFLAAAVVGFVLALGSPASAQVRAAPPPPAPKVSLPAMPRAMAAHPPADHPMPVPVPAAVPAASRAPATAPAPRPASPTVTRLVAPSPIPAPPEPDRYIGRNQFWAPGLGIDQSVASFPCSRSRPPGQRVYRWGCAGRGNVYLMAHASGLFRPLERAYEQGRLRTGQRVIYADDRGRVRTYRLVWWRVHAPTPDTAWAWASQARSSLTLQTCVGSSAESRLFVRYLEVPRSG